MLIENDVMPRVSISSRQGQLLIPVSDGLSTQYYYLQY